MTPPLFNGGWGRLHRRRRPARYYNLSAASWYRYKRWMNRQPEVKEAAAAISRDIAASLPDPMLGLVALSRVGVTFGSGRIQSRWAKFRIKFWLRLGRTARAQRIVLRQLARGLD